MSDTTCYHLGCPIWACDRWKGNFFTHNAPQRQFLQQYSSVFNTVEGNSTFYGIPSQDTVQRWADSTPDGFRFALKFPRAISHEQQLTKAVAATREFLDVLAVLHDADRLGPAFLQLSPTFSPRSFTDLEKFLRSLPSEFPYGVEVRHADFFDRGPNEHQLEDLLTDLQIDRVLFDSRPLFSAPPSDQHEVTSQARKPKSPFRDTVTGKHPMLRLVGRNDVQQVLPWVQQWAPIVASWIARGKKPYVFAHAPDDLNAPAFARMFHEELKRTTEDAGTLAPWPGELEPVRSRQLGLF